ncbi:coiled-coil domain-containing protein SCD2-like [Quercus lobata]|uniref:coiled-coil domain-containing protein SCD2-like n=1 Tax=Quercus lobata TaxID=97700 RepID=UPI001248539B|nr:coiled-coil domain-containing protein SCD2-like [Quercus lobata]
MDRMRPVYVRQKSTVGTPGAPSSPMMSPLHRHARSGSTGVANLKKQKAAAQRLAQVMAHQQADEDDEEDDLFNDYSSVSGGSIGLAGGRSMRSRSPLPAPSVQEQPPPVNSSSGGRSSLSIIYVEQPSSGRSISAGRPSQSSNSVEQPLSARSVSTGRSSLPTNSIEQPPSARSTSAARPLLGVKPVPLVPSSVPISLRPTFSNISQDVPIDNRRDKRMSLDFGSMNLKETSNQYSSALQDELDMLQEENESLLEKLRFAEERSEEAEERARQLEKQIANFGDGVTLEARHLSRKEAALQQREAALRVAAQTHGSSSEIIALRTEAESARDEATYALEQLHEAEDELKSLRIMTQRMILTQEEMEEVVLKRCWLARYWSFCVRHGIHEEIAGARYEYWSSFAPLPVDVVLAAGKRAKEEIVNDDLEEKEKVPSDSNGLFGEGNIENILLVEKGLRELASLKVEEAVALEMAQKRRPSSLKSGSTDEVKLPSEGQFEAFELSPEECEDVLFRQAWLTYFWRRAKIHGLEPDIADERLQFWINQQTKSPTSHDAVDVEKGFMELRKLGIETQLWEESRKWLEQDSSSKAHSQSDF